MPRRRTGTVREHPKGSGRWQARWWDTTAPEPKQVSKGGFTSKSAAHEFLQRQYADQQRGQAAHRDRAKVTFAEWADRWLEGTVDLKPSTADRYRRILRHHLLPRFGHVPVGQLDHPTMQAFVSELSASHAPQTVRNVVYVARNVFNAARLAGAIRVNPTADLRLPKQRHRDVDVLTAEQVATLAEAMPNELARVATFFAAYSGLRAAECWGLRVRHVDFTRGTVRVVETATDLASGGVSYGPPKSDASRRTVRLPRFLVDLLAAYVGQRAADPDAFVFVMPDGSPVRHGIFHGRFFRPTVERLVADATLPHHVRFHSLRHTAASMLINSGADVRAVKERLGHGSVQLTLNTYAHMWASRDGELADALDAMHAASKPPLPVDATVLDATERFGQ